MWLWSWLCGGFWFLHLRAGSRFTHLPSDGYPERWAQPVSPASRLALITWSQETPRSLGVFLLFGSADDSASLYKSSKSEYSLSHFTANHPKKKKILFGSSSKQTLSIMASDCYCYTLINIEFSYSLTITTGLLFPEHGRRLRLWPGYSHHCSSCSCILLPQVSASSQCSSHNGGLMIVDIAYPPPLLTTNLVL